MAASQSRRMPRGWKVGCRLPRSGKQRSDTRVWTSTYDCCVQRVKQDGGKEGGVRLEPLKQNINQFGFATMKLTNLNVANYSLIKWFHVTCCIRLTDDFSCGGWSCLPHVGCTGARHYLTKRSLVRNDSRKQKRCFIRKRFVGSFPLANYPQIYITCFDSHYASLISQLPHIPSPCLTENAGEMYNSSLGKRRDWRGGVRDVFGANIRPAASLMQVQGRTTKSATASYLILTSCMYNLRPDLGQLSQSMYLKASITNNVLRNINHHFHRWVYIRQSTTRIPPYSHQNGYLRCHRSFQRHWCKFHSLMVWQSFSASSDNKQYGALSVLTEDPANTVFGLVRDKAATVNKAAADPNLKGRCNYHILETDLTNYDALKVRDYKTTIVYGTVLKHLNRQQRLRSPRSPAALSTTLLPTQVTSRSSTTSMASAICEFCSSYLHERMTETDLMLQSVGNSQKSSRTTCRSRSTSTLLAKSTYSTYSCPSSWKVIPRRSSQWRLLSPTWISQMHSISRMPPCTLSLR